MALQTALLASNIGMLSPWGDEAFTLAIIGQPVGRLLATLRADIHPPLYFLLLQGWLHAPLAAPLAVRVRLFSALWTIVATVLVDRLWARRLPARARLAFLALWCTSPALLLYGRMGRSYTMQVAVALLAFAAGQRWLRSRRLRDGALTALAVVLALYTHYIPGLGIAAALNLFVAFTALRRRAACPAPPLGQLLALDAIAALAYAPWLLTLGDALARWVHPQSFSSHYSLTGNAVAEHLLRVTYTFVSFGIGETFPFLSLFLVPVLLAALILTFRRGVVRAWPLPPLVLLAAAFGYFGVAEWTSYPFMPARLLWVLPFFVLWLAGTPDMRPAWRGALVTAVLVSNAASIVNYFERRDFLNKGYALPMPAMAALIRTHSPAPPSTLVLLDTWNTDAGAFEQILGPGLPSQYTGADTLRAIPRLRARYGRIWVVRNSHDVSPGGITRQVEDAACLDRARAGHGFVPYRWWERLAFRLLRVPPPVYFYLVTECSIEASP